MTVNLECHGLVPLGASSGRDTDLDTGNWKRWSAVTATQGGGGGGGVTRRQSGDVDDDNGDARWRRGRRHRVVVTPRFSFGIKNH
uniref:Uncharacterized protein n=1 Tax=Oryza sativa subsp. indica TaxID=39946 RepID=A0A679B8Y9_ORYSI|nr:hypothetical protein [Oryza sativa Indica Group]